MSNQNAMWEEIWQLLSEDILHNQHWLLQREGSDIKKLI